MRSSGGLGNVAKEYVIKILAWKKYQNREVKTRSVWLRLQNDFIENPNFGEFSSDERVVWLYALCCASKLNQDSIQVPVQCSHRVLHRCTGIDEKTFHRTFEKLKKIRIVEIRTTRGRYADDTSAIANDTLRNETETLRDVTRRDGDVTSASAHLPPLAEIWNQHRGKLPEVLGCEGKRLKSANARWESKPATEYWAEIITRMSKSDFCLGKMNKPGPHENWKADFDFLIQPGTHTKVLEGKYDNKSGPSIGGHVPPPPRSTAWLSEEQTPPPAKWRPPVEASTAAEENIPDDQIGEIIDQELGLTGESA